MGYDKAGHPVTFQHPAIQSAFMFLGEFLCLFPYLIISWRNQNVRGRQSAFQRQQGNQKLTALFSFSLPALCDAGATTMLNVGLFYTYDPAELGGHIHRMHCLAIQLTACSLRATPLQISHDSADIAAWLQVCIGFPDAARDTCYICRTFDNCATQEEAPYPSLARDCANLSWSCHSGRFKVHTLRHAL